MQHWQRDVEFHGLPLAVLENERGSLACGHGEADGRLWREGDMFGIPAVDDKFLVAVVVPDAVQVNPRYDWRELCAVNGVEE